MIDQKTGPWPFFLPRYQPYWFFITLAFVSTAVFWITDWDIRIMKLFFTPGTLQQWPLATIQLWQFFYKAAPVLTLLPTVSALLVLIGSTWYPKLWRWRSAALFIVLCFALGPGLMVNVIFKDHWGRPRPRQVVELGGNHLYLPPLLPGDAGKGKSFPCGHSSVGFTYGAMFFILRAKRPRLAAAALAGGIILGMLMGIGRMAAGGHFFSDVLWSAYLPLGIAYLLSPMLQKTSQPSIGGPTKVQPLVRRRYEMVMWVALMVIFTSCALLAYPFKKDFQFRVPPQNLTNNLKSFEIIAKNSTITVKVTPRKGYRLVISGEGRGFGMPDNDLITNFCMNENGTLSYLIEYKGLFTDIETRLDLEVSRDLLNSGLSIYQRESAGENKNQILIAKTALNPAGN